MDPTLRILRSYWSNGAGKSSLHPLSLRRWMPELKRSWWYVFPFRTWIGNWRISGGGKWDCTGKTSSSSLLLIPRAHQSPGCRQNLDYLKNYRGWFGNLMTGLFESVTERTIELKMGKLNHYKGNYSFYIQESAARIKERKAAEQKKEDSEGEGIHQSFPLQCEKAAMVKVELKLWRRWNHQARGRRKRLFPFHLPARES